MDIIGHKSIFTKEKGIGDTDTNNTIDLTALI